MKTTITQISNIFNLLSQIDVRILNYHHGYRFDINQNNANNFDPTNATGTLFPAVMFDVPDNVKYVDKIDYIDVQEEIQCTLYFDDLQGYNNDGSLNVLNPVEQWQRLKQIAEDFLANFRFLFEDKYGAGVVGIPTFVPRSNLFNLKVITWEVSFQLTHAIPCTEEQYIIDENDFPDTLDDDDLERTTGAPPTACDRIISQLNDVLLLTCVLPLYDFSKTATQNALSAQQILDLKTWILPQYDFGDVYWQNLLTAQQDIDLTFYLLPLVDFTDPLIQAIITTQQKTDILNWLFPLLDFSQPSTQALVTSQQQIDLSNWLCGGVATEKSTRFDGINEQYTASQSTSLEIERTDLFTMDCWVYPEVLGVRQGISSKFNTVTVGRGWDFQILADNTASFRLSSDSVAGNIITCTTTTTLPLNTWTHVLVTYLGNSLGTGMKIYFNAVEQSVTQTGMLTGTTIGGAAKIFRISASIDGVAPIFYLRGYLYNFRLAKGVALTPAEIVTAYQIPLQPYPQLVNLSFACKLGTKGYFGTTTWVLEDYAGGVSGVQGVNIDLVDITTFLPPNT